jgi:two-component system, OmpR family, sensor histidine kinase ChvG
MSEPGELSVPRSRFSLRFRVIVTTLFVALVPQLLVFAWSQVERRTPGRLWGVTRDTMVEATPLLSGKSIDEARAPLEQLARKKHVWIRVVDVWGQPLVDAYHDDPREPLERVERFFLGSEQGATLMDADATHGPLMTRDWTAEAIRSGTYIDCDFGAPLLFCESFRVVTVPEATNGHVLMVVAQSSSRGVAAVYDLRHRLLRLALVTVPLAVVIAWFTASRVVRPIEQLKRQALERTSEARPHAVTATRDEAHDLAAALNALFAEIAARQRDHESFVADLVHELKSPVASLRAAAEALSGSTDERTARLSRSVDASARRLTEIIARFLELSRAEAGFPDEEREDVSVSAIAEAAIAEAQADPRYEGISFTVVSDPSARVHGVDARLSAMVRELVDNGASFVTAGGEVRVVVETDGPHVRLSVSDTGPGIAADGLERVFERYYTTRGHARGTGLGLPLVRAAAEAHGGRAWAESREDRSGAIFFVELPRAAGSAPG